MSCIQGVLLYMILMQNKFEIKKIIFDNDNKHV
jgi:hypothetical protein